MKLINLIPYIPETDALPGVLYLKDKSGKDWYQAQAEFKADTLKICVNEQQVIISAHADASTLWPVNLSVYEVSVESVPTGFNADGKWGWNGKNIISLMTIEKIKQDKIAQIKKYRDELTADYIIIDGHHFHSDANSRIQQLTLAKMGQAKQIPPGLMWQTKNHGLIKLTNDIATQFETETMAHDMRLFATAQRHIAAVEALKDVQTVTDYNYSQGWQP